MQTLTQPTLLKKPFAENGDKNSIPVTNDDVSNPQLADLTNGFPDVTSLDPDDGGIPAERKDFNGLGYLTTLYDYFYQAGGTFTFDRTTAVGIGGYPIGARLWYENGDGDGWILRSTKQENYDDFTTGTTYDSGTGTWVAKSGIIGDSWIKDTVTIAELKEKVPNSVGSSVKPVYTNGDGVVTASNSTVGSSSNPVYMNNGEITECSYTVGFPDFSNKVAKSSGSFPSDGWWFPCIQFTGGGDFYAYINGVEVMHVHGNRDGIHGFMGSFPVKAGNTCSISGANYGSYFCPMR